MDVAEVVNLESLKQYLLSITEEEHEQKQVAVRLNFLATARLLPIAIDGILSGERAHSPEFNAVAVFGAVADCAVSIANEREDESHPAGSSAFSLSAVTDLPAAAAAAIAAQYPYTVGSSISYAAQSAAGFHIEEIFWKSIQKDLHGNAAVWPDGMPDSLFKTWQKARDLMDAHPADWSFWIAWYERVLAGRDTLPDALVPIFNRLTREDWDKGPTHINPMFDEVLALYQALATPSSGAEVRERSANYIKVVSAQVSTLSEFLEAEYLSLAGHNARSPEEDEILELLKVLRSLVDEMIAQIDGSNSSESALVVVRDNLPTVVERTGELALVESQPVVSATILTMAASIRALVDAGADPTLATKIAMSEAAGQRLWPKIKGFFGRE